MYVLSHPDVQAGATPEAPPLAAHNALCGVVARAVCLLINSLLPVTTCKAQSATRSFGPIHCYTSNTIVMLMQMDVPTGVPMTLLVSISKATAQMPLD